MALCRVFGQEVRLNANSLINYTLFHLHVRESSDSHTFLLFYYGRRHRRSVQDNETSDTSEPSKAPSSAEGIPLIAVRTEGEIKEDPPVAQQPGAHFSHRTLYFLQGYALRVLALDQDALLASRETLRAAVEMGTIVLWFYIADRTPTIAAGPKDYIRDVFLFLFLVLTLVAGGYTMQQSRHPVLINRQQTEEWKGWMQVLFLLYHYYEAKEAYNAIRVFIASYVWMTGFGNFAYYYKTRDFSFGRFCQMMWRLNFLAFLCCVALDNEYMLYYICPMHTLYTIMVYAALGLWQKGNDTAHWGLWIKIAVCFAVVIGVWEIEPVFYFMWKPFTFLLGYTDPRRPNPDALHEWYFRTGLDRYIWIHGMMCALLHPKLETWLKGLEEPNVSALKRGLIRGLMVTGASGAFYIWYLRVFLLPKLEYNVLHPYTSWIPITAYLIIRNCAPKLRLHSMGLYGWLGCITLETCKFFICVCVCFVAIFYYLVFMNDCMDHHFRFLNESTSSLTCHPHGSEIQYTLLTWLPSDIAQYHTWLLSKVPNSQPIYLLSFLPGYPLLNFAVVTGVYIFLSHRLFILTSTLRDALIPHDDATTLRKNLVTMAVGIILLWGGGFLLVQTGAGIRG